MKSAFTLIELLVVIVIVSAFFALVTAGFSVMTERNQSDDGLGTRLLIFPEYENAKSQRIMANELKRQNDLLERTLDKN